MLYTSTRDLDVKVSSARAVIDGISKDGGLFVPVELPELDYRSMFELDYPARVEEVLKAFFDFDVTGLSETAYAGFDGDPAPIVKLDDGLYVLELWHGKTHAFKDMALSVMPHILSAAKKAEGDASTSLILVATSGDTGKAALEGFKNVAGTKVCVFYPTDGVSEVQKLAMQTQDGDNVLAVGITGNFDDAQTAVKNGLRDDALISALRDKNTFMSSANSINVARLVPQIAYYFSAYCDLVNDGEIKDGDQIDFVVPTGNFGNILAGYYAKKMGVPINKLVCASNSNNVLTDFIESGAYDVHRDFHKTISPSMDILVSSNLERLLFEISGHNAELVAERMRNLADSGRYYISAEEQDAIREAFACGYADDEAAEEAIADVFDEFGYLIDTHTAVAFAVAEKRGFNRATAIVSTANPYKFAPAVSDALGLGSKTAEASVKLFEKLEDYTAMEIPESLETAFALEKRFTEVIDPSAIIDFIKNKFSL